MNILKNKLKKQAEHDSVLTALIAVLVFLCCIFFPLPFKAEKALLIASTVIRFVFSVVALGLSLAYGLYEFLKVKKVTVLGIFAVLSGLGLAVSNFPIFELVNGQARFVAGSDKIVLYLFYCFFVAAFEELFFRGLVLPLFMIQFKNRKGGGVLAVLVSSAVFGAVHLFNIFSGAGALSVLLQVGYTFLVGLLCGAVFLITKSVVFPVLIHFVYNAGGLLTSLDIVSGTIWTTPSIIFMAIASVIAAVACILAIRFKP